MEERIEKLEVEVARLKTQIDLLSVVLGRFILYDGEKKLL